MAWIRKTTDRWALTLKLPGRGWGERMVFATREEIEPIVEAIRKNNYHKYLRHRTLMHVKRLRVGGSTRTGRPPGSKNQRHMEIEA